MQLTGLLIAFMVLMALPLKAQMVTIQGTITDADSQPLRGATVMVKNTFIGASAAIGGVYQLRVPAQDEVILVASFLGYQSIERIVQLAGLTEVTVDFQLEEDVLGLGDVVVTGVLNQQSKIESSISISTMDVESVSLSSPRTTAEIFRAIPGIRSEASAGEGNTNITVRGVPISAGGSKYLQLQEDGLPLLYIWFVY